MAGLIPTAVYGLEVGAGEDPIPSQTGDFPGAFRITMAAIDPTAEPIHPAELPYDAPPRATLKLIRVPIDMDDYDSDEEEDDEENILNGDMSDESDSGDPEANGGPSNASKNKRSQKLAGIEALKSALADRMDEDGEVDDVAAGKLDKGKKIALGNDEDESETGDDIDMDEFVVCTLDPAKNYQQTLDITVGEKENVFFKVTGSHTVYLTGNYIVPMDAGASSDDDYDEDYDLSPNEDELYGLGEESDDLDDLEDPRIEEIDTEDEEAPPLVTANGKSKKRAVEDVGLDDLIKADKAGSNKQKKQKNNAGEAVPAAVKDEPKKSDKKVQFAKNLEQGPTPGGGSKKADKVTDSKQNGQRKEQKGEQRQETGKSVPSVRTVQGVVIDDRKEGSGPAAKKGQKIGMRYIGKLNDGKVFDSNKKGKPFSFILGAGEVIKGWDIGVEGMKVGGERRIKVPAKLAYGNSAIPGIPKNSDLTFDLKLIEIR